MLCNVSIILVNLMLFMFSSPVMMSIGLIILTIISTYYSFLGCKDSWPAMIFCMVFFGGLLILFVYISSLAQNEKTQLSVWKLTFGLPLVLVLELFLPNWSADTHVDSVSAAVLLFSNSNYLLVVVMMLYLLIALIAVVKITFFYKGALREMKY